MNKPHFNLDTMHAYRTSLRKEGNNPIDYLEELGFFKRPFGEELKLYPKQITIREKGELYFVNKDKLNLCSHQNPLIMTKCRRVWITFANK